MVPYKRYSPLNYKAEQRNKKSLPLSVSAMISGALHGFTFSFGLSAIILLLFFLLSNLSTTNPFLPLEPLLNKLVPTQEVVILPDSWNSANRFSDLKTISKWPIESITTMEKETTVNVFIQKEPVYANLNKAYNRYSISSYALKEPIQVAAFLFKSYFNSSVKDTNHKLTVNLCINTRDGYGGSNFLVYSHYSMDKETANSIDWLNAPSSEIISKCSIK